MVRFREESAGVIVEGREVNPLASAVSLRGHSFQRFQTAYRGVKRFGGDVRRGTLTTLGDISDGTNTLSLYGAVGSLGLFVTGVGMRLFCNDDASHLFGEIGMATGAVGGLLSVTTALITYSLTKNLRLMSRM